MEKPVNARSKLLLATLLVLAACGGGAAGAGAGQSPTPAGRALQDSTAGGTNTVPAGYGSLKQDDIAVHFDMQNLQVKAIPLDEAVIRTLSPDSYRALRGLQESRRGEIDAAARRAGAQRFNVWYVEFYGLQPEVSFSPMEFVLTNNGREFRPVEVIPLTAGFGEQRLRQRERQSALYLFDDALDVSQPLTVTVQSTPNDSWQNTLRRVERERALIMSRASKAPNP
jgi:hypothetical protein